MIYGAVIGDIAGSRFEFNNYRNQNFEIFSLDSFCTDDTLMTIAVAQALWATPDNYAGLEESAIHYMQTIGRRHPEASWGSAFRNWLFSDDPKPYNSFGNGAAMRVSPVGWFAKDIKEAVELADRVTAVTHNHPEGIKGARAVASAVYLARTGWHKHDIVQVMKKYYPILGEPEFTTENIRRTYEFNETCQDTVPQAIQAFMESGSFEGAIRLAVSLGGDSDTLAAITGSIAEAYYGIPNKMIHQANMYLYELGMNLTTISRLEASV